MPGTTCGFCGALCVSGFSECLVCGAPISVAVAKEEEEEPEDRLLTTTSTDLRRSREDEGVLRGQLEDMYAARMTAATSSPVTAAARAGVRGASTAQPVSPAPRDPMLSPVAHASSPQEAGARAVVQHTASPASTSQQGVSAVMSAVAAAGMREHSPTEETLRRDLDVANRAVSDLWVQTHLIGGASGAPAGGVVRLLQEEVELRSNTAVEMRGDLLAMVGRAVRTMNTIAMARDEWQTAREDAVRTSVGRDDAVRSANARAEEAEARARVLQQTVDAQRAEVIALQGELREVQSARALREIAWQSERERLRHIGSASSDEPLAL